MIETSSSKFRNRVFSSILIGIEVTAWISCFAIIILPAVQTLVIAGRLSADPDSRGIDFPYSMMWDIGVAKIICVAGVMYSINRLLNRSVILSSFCALAIFLCFSTVVSLSMYNEPNHYPVFPATKDKLIYVILFFGYVAAYVRFKPTYDWVNALVFGGVLYWLFWIEDYHGYYGSFMRTYRLQFTIGLSIFVLTLDFLLRILQLRFVGRTGLKVGEWKKRVMKGN